MDLFGFIDIIALDPKRGVIAVQSTGSDFAEHYTKITTERREEALRWLQTPGTTLILYGWRKIKKVRGKKAMIWSPRIREITLKDFG